MLPYRLRPPTYGTKLKQIKKKESFFERTYPYRDGGPLERAIESDLRALVPVYEHKLDAFITAATSSSTSSQNDSATDTLNLGPVPIGTAFRAFREVFATAKVAVLFRSSTNSNSGLMPQRCDRNAYSQLVYSACLALLRDFFTAGRQPTPCPASTLTQLTSDTEWDDHVNMLRRVSYAVFTLYSLYHTNPLPSNYCRRNNSTNNSNNEAKASSLAKLPMGLQDRENPKIIYRHSLRSPVRIDLDHYSYLLQIGHLANAALSRYEQTRGFSSTNGWNSVWAVAADLSMVLHRILDSTPNMLECCSYTGPCGLEGLAGHRDYPHPISNSSRTPTTNAVAPLNDNATTTEPVSPTMVGPAKGPTNMHTSNIRLDVDSSRESSPPPVPSNHLEEALQNYATARQSMRIPMDRSDGGSQKLKRVREALLPMFTSQQGNDDDMDHVSTLLCKIQGREHAKERPLPLRKRSKFRHVSFSAGNSSELESQSLSICPPEQDASVTSNDPSTPNGTFDLILPPSVNKELQGSVYAAVRVLLLDRRVQLFPATSPCDKTPVTVTNTLVETNDHIDGTSTLGDNTEGISVAQSSLAATTATTSSAVGRTALRTLLAKAKSDLPSPSRPSVSYNSIGDFFLETTSTKRGLLTAEAAEKSEEDSQVSDLSSGDDEVSVAASRVGQRALQALLNGARRTQPTRRRRRGKQLDQVKPNAKQVTTRLDYPSDESDSSKSSIPIGHGASALDKLLLMSKASR